VSKRGPENRKAGKKFKRISTLPDLDSWPGKARTALLTNLLERDHVERNKHTKKQTNRCGAGGCGVRITSKRRQFDRALRTVNTEKKGERRSKKSKSEQAQVAQTEAWKTDVTDGSPVQLQGGKKKGNRNENAKERC